MNNLKGKSLLLFGDSIMYGSGNDGYGVGEFLVNDAGVGLHKYCIGGARVGYRGDKSWVVDQVCQAIEDRVKADIIVFDGFTNDCCMSGTNDYCDVPLGEVPDKEQDIFEIRKAKPADFSLCFDAVCSALKKYFPEAKCLFVRPHRMGKRNERAQMLYGDRAVEICKKYGFAVADIYKDSDLNTFLVEHRDLYTCDSYGQGHGDCTHPNELCYKQKYMPLIEKALNNL